jgi:hypothetical protein
VGLTARLTPSLNRTRHIKSLQFQSDTLSLEQILQKEIETSETWLRREQEESTYKRDLQKRIELINWALQNMRNPNVEICGLIEYRMNEIIQEINKTDSIFDADKLHNELRILDWIFYQVCKDQQMTLQNKF